MEVDGEATLLPCFPDLFLTFPPTSCLLDHCTWHHLLAKWRCRGTSQRMSSVSVIAEG
jgi:hypothetical protein